MEAFLGLFLAIGVVCAAYALALLYWVRQAAHWSEEQAKRQSLTNQWLEQICRRGG